MSHKGKKQSATGRSAAAKSTYDRSVKKQKAKIASGKAKKSRSKADIKKEVTAKVSTALGLTTVPNTPPPGQKWSGMDSATSTVATNLIGKDQKFYGEEASALTDEYLKDYKGMGVYTTSGNLIGGNVVSKSAVDVKYGKDGVMGSGDPTGVMSSIPISNEMLQFQNKVKTGIGLGMSLVMPGIASYPAKLMTAKSSADALQPGKAYEEYQKKFKAKQSGQKFTSDRNLLGILGLKQDKKTKKDTLG